MHAAASRFFINNLKDLEPKNVLEIGSVNINGSVRDFYPQAISWWGIDIVSGPCVDEVADGSEWSSEKYFELAICAEVFEHTPKWKDIITNMHKHLAPNGILLATCASRNRPPHSANGWILAQGEYYHNVSPEEMDEHLKSMSWNSYQIIQADGDFGDDDLYIRCVK